MTESKREQEQPAKPIWYRKEEGATFTDEEKKVKRQTGEAAQVSFDSTAVRATALKVAEPRIGILRESLKRLTGSPGATSSYYDSPSEVLRSAQNSIKTIILIFQNCELSDDVTAWQEFQTLLNSIPLSEMRKPDRIKQLATMFKKIIV